MRLWHDPTRRTPNGKETPFKKNLVVVLPQCSVEKEGYGQEAEENEDVEEVTTPAGASYEARIGLVLRDATQSHLDDSGRLKAGRCRFQGIAGRGPQAPMACPRAVMAHFAQ